MALSGDVSMQEKMRLGDVTDIYYYGTKTLEKQAIPTVQDTRFFQALPNLFSGSSTFIISPDQGVSDVIVGVRLPAVGELGVTSYNGLSLTRGWAYQLVNKISVRYGGSSQYFFTGEQIFVQNMRECSNPTSRDALVQLGGNELKKPSDFAGDNLYGYIVLNLPHSSPNGSLEKPNPFPSELLNQPIVITLEINPIQSIFKTCSGVLAPAVTGGNATPPNQLADGWFQVRQVHAMDGGMLMRPMGAGAGYSYPLKAFYQNEIQVRLRDDTAQQPITLTGFRAGDVRSIFFWIEDRLALDGVSPNPNPYAWVNPRDVQLIYNGTVYQNYKGTSAQMWDLMATDVPSQFANSVVSRVAGTNDPALALSSTAVVTNWINLPFSQVYEQLSGCHLMVHGKKIENAVVNVLLNLPQKINPATGLAVAGDYVMHAVYAYNSLLFCSAGSSEYIF
jgi:hypothetical protein